MSSPAASPNFQKGVVKQVLSGDTIIIRGQPRGGPPPERTVCLSNITAPKLARRPNPNIEGSVETKDEPFAWEAREFLRKKLIGKEVVFTVEYQVPGTGREYGIVYLGKDSTGENVTEQLVKEGLVDLRKMGLKADDPNQQRLIHLEEVAKTAGRGKHAEAAVLKNHVRDIKWTIEDPRKFVDSKKRKPIEAVIEHVRDGCTVRAFLLPSFDYVTVMLSGIKCPMNKQDADGKQVPEPFMEEAKFFTESRLLQKDVKIILEGVSNQNLLGTVLHPNGNITEFLLKEGFARCVDWSMGVVTQGIDKLRAAEKAAKEKRLRIWKDYKPPANATDAKSKAFQATVVEIVNGDALVVKTEDKFKKVFLSSIRPPRLSAEAAEAAGKEENKRPRPLYDIPYMFEAREFMRKKMIGKKVSIQIDYVQPAKDGFPEKCCCTVLINGVNVGEALVSKGLATVIRYRQDDDQRSSRYDDLLLAESRAIKKAVGLHSKKESPLHKVADISGDAPKAKQFLPFLQRAGKSQAVVEFIASGSRLRLYLPKETCLITLLVAGIECPKGARSINGQNFPADKYGDEALLFTKEMCMQREVEVEVESMDKGGNFIGWLFVDGENLSEALVEAGLAKVHFTAERSRFYNALLNKEKQAKEKQLKVWTGFTETVKVSAEEEPLERKINYNKVIVTEVTNKMTFYAQNHEKGQALEKLMEDLRAHMESNPPTVGAYSPKRGDICAARFSQDRMWYRAKVEDVSGSNVSVHFVDYGNKEKTTTKELAALPDLFKATQPQASEYGLACVCIPEDDEDAKQDALDALYNDILNRVLLLNVEYRGTNVDCVSLKYADSEDDVISSLVKEGYFVVEERRERKLVKMVSEYMKAQKEAMKERKNLWRYGDFREDNAREFGYSG